MTFVPTPVVTPTEQLTPRARDLARTLEGSLQEYRQRNPSISDPEVRQALEHLARRHSPAARTALVIALGLGVAILGVVLFMYLRSGPAGGTDNPVQWVAMGVGALAALVGLAVAATRNRGG